MALFRRAIALASQSNLPWLQSVPFTTHHAFLAAHESATSPSPLQREARPLDGEAIASRPSDGTAQPSSNPPEEFAEFLSETANEVEEHEAGEAPGFAAQQEAMIEELEDMVQDASLSRRQAPLPEDFVPPPQAAPENGPPRTKAPQQQQQAPPKAPVHFPTFIPPVNKSRAVAPAVSLDEALKFIKKNAKAKFDETVEAVIKLGINPKRGDQMVRGAASLPNGSGKPVRIAVFASGPAAEEAKAAGADVVGAEDLVEAIKTGGGKLNFDRCIATPAMMPMLGQVARILGPRGLMPNPKVGTITNDVAEAVRATKRGRVNFRADKGGTVHVGLGKVSFTEQALKDNLGAFAAALLDAKPAGAKGVPGRYAGYLLSLDMSSSMGPGVKVDVKNVGAMAEALRAQRTS